MAQLVGGLGGGGSPSSPPPASVSSGSTVAAAPPPPAPLAAPGPSSSSSSTAASTGPYREPPRSSFSRPAFLQLTPEELLRADDHTGRAVQSPRESRRRLPWSTGYAE